MSTIDDSKKKRGRPEVDSEAVGIRVLRADLDKIEAFAHARGIKRSDAMRLLMMMGLDAAQKGEEG